MSTSRIAFVLAVVLSSAAGAPVMAQQGPGGRPSREEAFFRMVEAYFVSNMQEALALSDEQFGRVLPLVKRLQRDRREAGQRRMKSMQELRRVMQAGGATEARVAELLREVKAAEVEGPELVRRDIEALDAALSPVQQAKYRLMEVEVERRIREAVSEMRLNRPRRAPPFPEN